MKEINSNIKSGVKFKVGDIVQYKTNPNLRYIVTSISSMSNKPTWSGLSCSGHPNGGTIEGSWNFDDWKVINHYPLEEVYNYIKRCEDINGEKE